MVDARVLLSDDHVAAHLDGPDGFRVLTNPRCDSWYDQEAWRTAKPAVLAHLQAHPECESAERARRWLVDRALERIELAWNEAGRPAGVWKNAAVVGMEDELLRVWRGSRHQATIAATFPVTLWRWEAEVIGEIKARAGGVAA